MSHQLAALALQHPVHHALSSATQPSDIGRGLIGALIAFLVLWVLGPHRARCVLARLVPTGDGDPWDC